MEIYCDGSCILGPDGIRYAGVGIWFGHNDIRNQSIPVFDTSPTNQLAELLAILYSLRICGGVSEITIYTDSMYSINCITIWHKTWVQNNWMTAKSKPVLHSDIIITILNLIKRRRESNFNLSILHVKAHSGIHGNEGADKLAVSASTKIRDESMTNTRYFSSGYLSQFYMAPIAIEVNGNIMTYNCNEQYHHHSKALMFNDTERADEIMQAREPYEQKRLGRQVRSFNNTEWLSLALDICIRGNMAKFTQNVHLRDLLLSTGNKRLVEAREDNVWGIGISLYDALAGKKWNGTNLLGRALMIVRDKIKQEF